MKRCSYQRTAFTIGQDDRLSGQDDHHSDKSPRVIPNVTRSERLSIKLTRSELLSIKLGYETRQRATPERGSTRRYGGNTEVYGREPLTNYNPNPTLTLASY